ncbi:hypothetical protein Ahy_B08g090239 [Arachis hypogaea]|uniref:Uncharacterized protein n=1 Tax=Arachis hypogaea TaxID=3818 RepID=A0A444XZS7_ARAHY|nr:hypothetical protein Ahy_B08g090239 [Arachis hypogaea]
MVVFQLRTSFSDKDEAKDQKERTPQTNKIGPSRLATYIGERPYVDLTVQGFDPNQAEVGDKIPENTMFTFYPQKEMRLAGTDLAVAAYIFGMVKDKREILVSDLHCYGDKEAFQTLVPGRRFVDDIIILVATMLTYNSGRLIWYLPPTFAALFLEEIVLDESWYACKRHERPTISEFKLVEPELNQQEVGT